MAERVIITLDVTTEEADAIAQAIAGVGPYYKAFNLAVMLDELADMTAPQGKLKRCGIRSDASAELGGPDAF